MTVYISTAFQLTKYKQRRIIKKLEKKEKKHKPYKDVYVIKLNMFEFFLFSFPFFFFLAVLF